MAKRDRDVYQPDGIFNMTGCSPTFEQNVNMINDCAKEARWQATDMLIGVEIARQLDRSANAPENMSK